MSSLRDAFEETSAPVVRRLSALPRVVPFVVVLAAVLAGFLIPGWGWVLLALVALFLTWLLLLGWPRLTTAERMMRIAVLAVAIALTVTQAWPR